MTYSQPTLHRLIEKYFDATATLDEERQLRAMLADPAFDSAEADEARAVLSVSLVSPPLRTERRLHRRFRPLAVAASLAVLLALGATLLTSRVPEPDCVAYIGGQRVDNPDRVMEMVNADLSLLGSVQRETATDITNQFSELASAINESAL